MSQRGPRLLVAVGEPSGDALAGAVVAELRRRGPLEACGVVGPRLRDAGVQPLATIDGLSAVGLVDGLKAAGRALRVVRQLDRHARAHPPDLLLTVDAPSFTLRLARRLKPRGVPVLHIGAPQVWAWRPDRRRHLHEAVSELLCLLPFEPDWFVGHLPATYVGHPAADLPVGDPDPAFTVALLPGSRPAEVRRLWPVLRQTARAVAHLRPDAQFVTLRAPGVPPLTGLAAREVPTMEAVGSAHVAVVASGTATLQLAAMGVPMVVVYRTDPLTWAVARRVVHTPYVALPNVIAGKAVVPERLQHLDPQRLAHLALEEAAKPRLPLQLDAQGAVSRMADAAQQWLRAAHSG